MRVGRARLVGPDTASHRVVDALRARPNWIPRDGIELGFRLGTALRTASDADGVPLARHRLTPRFRHYAEDDLRCQRAVIVARKRRATGA
jgi:hypothetical protein